MNKKESLKVLVAGPRGFCAGVDRAIQIVETALDKFGAPVYVRHEIVHNRYVVEGLQQRGAIFVDELDEVPGDAPVVFSAHGVPKSVPNEAKRRNLMFVDATCPLVSKVHREAERHFAAGYHILLIGHAGHPEVIGSMGQLPNGAMTLIETVDDAKDFETNRPDKIAYITQTTLSVDDTADIIDVLMRRFPSITPPRKEDICYATTNRQEATKAIAGQCDHVLVIGAPNSSNSRRLVEVAQRCGAQSTLIQRATDIDWSALAGVSTLGITAGASAPEILVKEVVEALRQRYEVLLEEVITRTEDVSFKLPSMLTE
ncbi:MAG: 4-hydroxy-3-methylbut-2-enyl diphosphate reductase [Alphaproteobacteria bacterium]|nr:MAG: 4-hydroxy-3-methylbut-2-enyl diphosphate reductase [Alphaproteobacteria bacterium]